MAATHDAFGRHPRAYRPSYSYKYVQPATTSTRRLSQSSSIGFFGPIDEAWPSQEGMPQPETDFPTSLEFHRHQRTAFLVAKAQSAESTHNRRRTDSTLLRNDLGHSAPTVAKSRLTASVSGNDISQPSPRPQRLRFPTLRKDKSPSGSVPSRIPTPTHIKKVGCEGARQFSTPILPSQRTKQEMVQPKTLRLLGPISPTRQQPAMPKSRTMGMISTLTSSFSRSNLNLSTMRKVSAGSARTSEPTISMCPTSSPPLPTFTTNLRQIHSAQTYSYWCGRFQALHDRFSTEHFDHALSDPAILIRYIPAQAPSTSSSLFNITNIANNDYHRLSRDMKGKNNIVLSYDAMADYENKAINEIVRLMERDEAERQRKILMHLEMLCVTNDARKSLWEWQVAFARSTRNENLLPQGGKMVDIEKGRWVSRVGRAMGGGLAKSETMSNLGRRSGLGMLGKRKTSAMGLNQHASVYGPLGQVY